MMVREQLMIDGACLRCRQPVAYGYVQRCFDGRLTYSESLNCPHCGTQEEGDGVDLPSDVRDLFLERFGRWRLKLVTLGDARQEFIRRLAKVREMALRDAMKVIDAAPPVLAEGTRPEVTCLQQQLAVDGVEMAIERIA